MDAVTILDPQGRARQWRRVPRRSVALAPLIVALVLFAGCGGGRVLRLEQGLAELRDELAVLRQAQAGVGEAQAALAREVAELREALQGARAEAAARQREAERARGELVGSLDEAGRRIDHLGSRLEAVGGRLLRLEGALDALRDELDQLEAVAPPPRPSDREAAPPEELYTRALERYRAGEFGQAVLEFEEFVSKFRSHPLAGNAQYWIGEAYFLHRDFQQAVTELRKALDLAPRGDKAPESLFRLGLAYRALKRPTRAREVWEQLLRDFPQSEAARQARVALREGRDPTAGPASGK